jgi:hypothetical protein
LAGGVGAVVATAEYGTDQHQDPKDPTEERQGDAVQGTTENRLGAASGAVVAAAPSLGAARLVVVPRQVALAPLVLAVLPKPVEVASVPGQAAVVPSHEGLPNGPALIPLAVDTTGHVRTGVPDPLRPLDKLDLLHLGSLA